MQMCVGVVRVGGDEKEWGLVNLSPKNKKKR